MESTSSAMRLTAFVFLAFLMLGSASAQTFTDRSDLLDEQNGPKHFSWSVSIADLDGNGLPDIHEPGILYLQQEDGSFVSSLPWLGITYRPLPPPLVGYEGRGLFGSVMADVDDDGFNELFIMDILDDSSKVFDNAFGLRLTEVSPGNGIEFKGLGQGGAFADFNGDGTLDFFFGEEQGSNQIYLNNGSGHFTETTDQANIFSNSQTYGVATADYDNDGDMDVFIAACAATSSRAVNLLFRNNGDGTFEEVGAAAGINDNGNAWGVNFLDYDRDGWLDIHLANMRIASLDGRGNANKLYRNKGDGTFEDVSAAAGIEGNDDSYGSSVADFNNDGWPDIWVANFSSPASILINNGDGTFSDAYASSGLSLVFYHLSVAVADFNKDGWIDAYTGSDSDDGLFSRLLINDGGTNHWLSLRLVQEAPNRQAIGARVHVWTDGVRQIRDITAGDGFVSQNLDLMAHFGLGSSVQADSVVVRWPDGQTDRWNDVMADQHLTLAKGGEFNEPPVPFRTHGILTKQLGKRVMGEVSWEPSSDPEGRAVSYRVAIREPGGRIAHVSDDLSETSYTFEVDTTGTDPSGVWEFAVTASDGMHVRRSLNVGTALTGSRTSRANETPSSFRLESLWPQPSTGRFSVRLENSVHGQGRWDLVDLQGRVVQSGSLLLLPGDQTIEIDAGTVSSGTYMLRMISQSALVHRPVLIVGTRR